MPEPEVLQEAVPSLGEQHEGSSPAKACQKTPDTSSLQLDDGANVGNANQEIPDSPQANIHEQVPGATVQQHIEVAGLEPATDTRPAGQLQTGCRRSTRIRHQQGVSQKGGNAMIAVVSPQQPLLEGPDDDGLHLAEPRSHPLSPSTVQEALSGPDAAEWQAAIDEEVQACLAHNVWEPCKLPAGKHALPTRFVLARKRDGRYKARLVAGGHRQRPGRDFQETFAPVCSYRTLRMVLAVSETSRG
jgi:hypothetical protein